MKSISNFKDTCTAHVHLFVAHLHMEVELFLPPSVHDVHTLQPFTLLIQLPSVIYKKRVTVAILKALDILETEHHKSCICFQMELLFFQQMRPGISWPFLVCNQLFPLKENESHVTVILHKTVNPLNRNIKFG